MSLIYPFKKCIGIEFLHNLTDLSLKAKEKYDSKIDSVISSHSNLFDSLEGQKNNLEFINGDFLKENWNDTSVILANSTCFSPELMNSIGQKANKECKSGTIIVTFTKRLNNLNQEWELKDGFRRLMTWGIATVYVHRRK